jgi:cytochrome c5
MSQNEHDAEHQSLIKTPKQLVTVVVLALLVPVVLFVLLSQFIANMRSVDMNSAAMTPDEVAKRLKPVGDLAFAESGGDAASAPKSGEEIYKTVCSVCHASGVAGAPKLGDSGGWSSRIKEGQKELVSTAIAGKGAMPPRGGSAGLSDLEVERAVVYMANQAGAKFKEPAAPAAEKTAAAATAGEKTAGAAPAEKTAAVAPGAGKIDGKKIFASNCVACHGEGVAGAPKAGDKAAWAPRLQAGTDALYKSALNGKNAMPPRGGNKELADAEVKAAVDYMVSLAK